VLFDRKRERDEVNRHRCDWLHEHHHNEETHFFPAVESLTNTPGLMSANIEQHRAFDTGLSSLSEYAASTTPEEYDGTRG
jgi:hypothetical protein